MRKSNYDTENKLRLFMSTEEQRAFYNEILDRVIQNPRFYLDNLEYLSVFRVSFINYTWNDKKSLKSRNIYK